MTPESIANFLGIVGVVWAGVMILFLAAYGIYLMWERGAAAKDRWVDSLVDGLDSQGPATQAPTGDMIDVRGFTKRWED